MQLLKNFLLIAVWTITFIIIGGFTGFVTAVICEETGLVTYSHYVDSWRAGFRSFFIGAGTGGLLGFAWSVRRCYLRLHPVVEVEEEVW